MNGLIVLFTKLLITFGLSLAGTYLVCRLLLQAIEADQASAVIGENQTLSLQSFSSLHGIQQSHKTLLHVFDQHYGLALLSFSCLYLLKQTFAIPGSAILNIFAGSVLPLYVAFPLVSILTACGASACYLLSWFLASDALVTQICDRLVPHKLQQLRDKIDTAKAEGQLVYLLLFLRIFPFTPNWFLNLASPWLQVPLKLFTPAVCFGLMPYNFITVQAGAMISTLQSTKDILDAKTIGSLMLLAIGMLIPILLKKRQSQNANQATQKIE